MRFCGFEYVPTYILYYVSSYNSKEKWKKKGHIDLFIHFDKNYRREHSARKIVQLYHRYME